MQSLRWRDSDRGRGARDMAGGRRHIFASPRDKPRIGLRAGNMGDIVPVTKKHRNIRQNLKQKYGTPRA